MTELLKVVSPFDLSVIKEIPLSTEAEVEQAISTASGVFNDRKNWLPHHERIAILERLAILMDERKEQLIKTALLEGGKPYKDSVVEVNRAIEGVKLGIQSVHELKGEEVRMGLTPSSAGRMASTFYEPIGPVVSLSAFNHPLNLVVHQTIPAVAAGCPVIVKPARATPLSCIEFGKLLLEAGLPAEWCQVLVTPNQLSEKLATDPRIHFLSFIGSAGVGWRLRSRLAPGTRCALEHGGVAPVIVDKSFPVDELVAPLLKGAFYHAGQVCVSVQKVFVPEESLEKFLKLAVPAAEALKVGDPQSEATDIGPLITPSETSRVDEWVSQAKAEGATIATGGKPLSETCYAPTILVNPAENSRVSREEIFGPVMCVYTYRDRQQAFDLANSLPFAFQASVFSKDIDVALDAVQQLNASSVMVNDHTAFRVDWMPFGGRQHSGLGMGGIFHSTRDMSREKLVVFKSPAL